MPDPNKPVVTTTTTHSLAEVPGISELLKHVEDIPVRLSPLAARPLGEADADTVGLGESSFDNPNENSYMDALTFDNAQAMPNPMADLHMPTLEKFGVTGKATGKRAAVIAAARKLLGTPYVWGGTSRTGVDCSGLIQLIFGEQGVKMPRISADQARNGKRVGLGELKAGDLVGWDNSSRNNGADHIALYIGNGLIIEAPRPGGVVQISHLYDKGNAWGVSLDY